MKSNPITTRKSQGCKPLAPALAPGKLECVHAGGDLEPLLAPFGGCNKQVLPRACTPTACTPHSPHKPSRITAGTDMHKTAASRSLPYLPRGIAFPFPHPYGVSGPPPTNFMRATV